MALSEADIDEDFIRSAGAIVVTGTHFSKPGPAAALKKAMRVARAAGGRVAFDIDYRPNLWGLAGHAAGEERYIRSETRVGASAGRSPRLRPDRRDGGGDSTSRPARRTISKALRRIRVALRARRSS